MVSQSIIITDIQAEKKNAKTTIPPPSATVPTAPETPTNNESVYGSASEYSLRFSYSDYDLYRSVIEIALNVSFLAATSNQLRLLISFREAQDFIISMTLVTLSLMMQISIAVVVVTIAVNDHYRWLKLKAFTSMAAILLTVVNVVIPFVMNAEHSYVDFSRIYPH